MLDLYHQPYAWVVEGCLVPTFAQCHMAALHANRLTIDAKDVKFLQALQNLHEGAVFAAPKHWSFRFQVACKALRFQVGSACF